MRNLAALLLLILLAACTKNMQLEKNETGDAAALDSTVEIKADGVDGMDVLFIIAQEGFQDDEYGVPKKILEDDGIRVVTATITTDKAVGKYGLEVMPDVAVRDVDPKNFSMIVMIGGPGAPVLADYPEVLTLLQAAAKDNMRIGAICIAPTVLAKAGILQGRKATVWHSIVDREPIDILEENGAAFVDDPVVMDGNIITGNGPDAAQEFGEAVLRMIQAG